MICESEPGVLTVDARVRTVVVVVRGGVAEVEHCSPDVDVEIRDYDNGWVATECAADDADVGPF